MKLDLVKELMNEFETSTVSKMKIEIEGIKLELEKNTGTVAAPVMAQPQTVNMPVQEAVPNKVEEVVKKEPSNNTLVKSPIVGTYYASSGPDSDPFVEVGSTVKKGQTLCIIEAMKVMNEIKSPLDGKVTEIFVSNDDLVEFDQVIMAIE